MLMHFDHTASRRLGTVFLQALGRLSAWSPRTDADFLRDVWHFTCIISSELHKSEEDTVLEKRNHFCKATELANQQLGSSSGWFSGPHYFAFVFNLFL